MIDNYACISWVERENNLFYQFWREIGLFLKESKDGHYMEDCITNTINSNLLIYLNLKPISTQTIYLKNSNEFDYHRMSILPNYQYFENIRIQEEK